jgi:hypothetical protein
MATYVSLFREQCPSIQLVRQSTSSPFTLISRKMCCSTTARAGPGFCIRRDVSDSDALDSRPGTRPNKRMVGNDIVLVLPVSGLPRPHRDMHLVLRFDPDGEVFAATSRRTNDSS